MEASELRIGNFVTPKVGAKNIFSGLVIVVGWNEIKRAQTLGDKWDHKPISLTEEWLGEKFGFDKVKPRGGVMAAYKKGGIRIDVSHSGNCYWKGKPIYSVQTLQNVYYFNQLTGEELEIKEIVEV